jgi:hypothetical protein
MIQNDLFQNSPLEKAAEFSGENSDCLSLHRPNESMIAESFGRPVRRLRSI